jgi:hypothetical protein
MIIMQYGEEEIAKSNDLTVVLTTHSLYKNEDRRGQIMMQEIPLEKLVSIETRRKQSTFLAFFGIIAAFMTMYLFVGEDEGNSYWVYIPSSCCEVISLLLWFITRKTFLVVSGDENRQIWIDVTKATQASVSEFAKKIKRAKADKPVFVSNLKQT